MGFADEQDRIQFMCTAKLTKSADGLLWFTESYIFVLFNHKLYVTLHVKWLYVMVGIGGIRQTLTC